MCVLMSPVENALIQTNSHVETPAFLLTRSAPYPGVVLPPCSSVVTGAWTWQLFAMERWTVRMERMRAPVRTIWGLGCAMETFSQDQNHAKHKLFWNF